jgi:hypothetical protein
MKNAIRQKNVSIAIQLNNATCKIKNPKYLQRPSNLLLGLRLSRIDQSISLHDLCGRFLGKLHTG